MIINKGLAISTLEPNAEFVVVDDTEIRWMSEDITQPTDEAIEAEIVRLKAVEAYQKPRRDEYPLVGDQLDMLCHAIEADPSLQTTFAAFYNAIKAIKDKHPKP